MNKTLRFLLQFVRVKPDKSLKVMVVGKQECRWIGITRQTLFSSLKGITPLGFLSFFLTFHSIFHFLLTYLIAYLFSKCYFHLIKLFSYFLSISTPHSTTSLSFQNLCSFTLPPFANPEKPCPYLHSPPCISVFWTVLSL